MSYLGVSCKKKEGVFMKHLLNGLRARLSVVKVMNICALLVAAYTVNVTCGWIQHQPEVPEEAKMLRKF